MKSKVWLIVVVAVVVGAIVIINEIKPQQLGSVTRSNDYHATTTLSGTAADDYHIAAQNLGSVIITSSSGSIFTIYDTGIVSTTPTTTLAIFPINATAGTYTFDRIVLGGYISIRVPASFTGTIITTYR